MNRRNFLHAAGLYSTTLALSTPVLGSSTPNIEFEIAEHDFGNWTGVVGSWIEDGVQQRTGVRFHSRQLDLVQYEQQIDASKELIQGLVRARSRRLNNAA